MFQSTLTSGKGTIGNELAEKTMKTPKQLFQFQSFNSTFITNPKLTKNKFSALTIGRQLFQDISGKIRQRIFQNVTIRSMEFIFSKAPYIFL